MLLNPVVCWLLLGGGMVYVGFGWIQISFCLLYVLCCDQQNCFPLAVLDYVLFVFFYVKRL